MPFKDTLPAALQKKVARMPESQMGAVDPVRIVFRDGSERIGMVANDRHVYVDGQRIDVSDVVDLLRV